MKKNRVAVIGSGIVGITTAFELAQKGYQVSVFDQNQTPAEESSFANGGVISPGYVAPWAAPQMPKRVLGDLWSRYASTLISWPSWEQTKWLASAVKNSNIESFWLHRGVMQRLALKSQARMKEISNQLRIEYERQEGYNIIYRSPKSWQNALDGLPYLSALGINHKAIEPSEFLDLEPALESSTKWAGAIHLPDDEVANCRQFAIALKNECEKLGVEFHYKSRIAPLSASTPKNLVTSDQGVKSFDQVVVCAGMGSQGLVANLPIRLPIVPVFGYSLTALIREPLDAPRCGLMDENYKVTISRMGNRIRVGGIMEFSQKPQYQNPKALQTLYKVLDDWFPKASDLSQQIQIWKEARPMLAKGSPIVSSTEVDGLWVNVGHGSSGWAMSCASAQVLLELMEEPSKAKDWPELALKH
jgi:D-amino-acid dehydrogenase